MSDKALIETYLYSARGYENDAFLYEKYGPGPYLTRKPEDSRALAKACREAAEKLLTEEAKHGA